MKGEHLHLLAAEAAYPVEQLRTASGLKSGALTVAPGTAVATFGVSLDAAFSLALGFEETRRAVKGEKSLAEGAVNYWKKVQQNQLEEVEREGKGVGGALKFVGARFGQVGAGAIHYSRKGIVRALEFFFD
jgi:hypothetical protein